MFTLFPRDRDKYKLRRIFRTARLKVLEDIPEKCFARYIDSDLPMFNINQDLANKLHPALRPSNLKERVVYIHVDPQKSKRPRRL